MKSRDFPELPEVMLVSQRVSEKENPLKNDLKAIGEMIREVGLDKIQKGIPEDYPLVMTNTAVENPPV